MGAGLRDLALSLAILLPIIGLVALVGRSCSFSPGGPTVDPSSVPTVNPRPALVAAAPGIGFPLRVPALPPGWRATSVSLAKAPGERNAARIGYLTPGGRYLRLVQTTAEEGALVAAETGGQPTGARPVTSAGAEWVDYTGGDGDQAWARRAAGVQYLITGDGLPAEFDTLARAVRATPALRG